MVVDAAAVLEFFSNEVLLTKTWRDLDGNQSNQPSFLLRVSFYRRQGVSSIEPKEICFRVEMCRMVGIIPACLTYDIPSPAIHTHILPIVDNSHKRCLNPSKAP